MNTIDTLIERSWRVHDEARDQKRTTAQADRLRHAIWRLEDALDENSVTSSDPKLGDLPERVRDSVVSVLVARVHVQAVMV
ncbi:hypothetical protein VX037_18100 [Gordonia sp. Z-3]|uniref:hypothetical protein n=1 Tax=Gordonia sp. Z-3 TaxID=3115408 RepID=UPI002E29B567|nr:hypothetical protein [Gordonia sp. Z-3]MED5802940.1 hypothetical protein [Gordonia sp. Z-3]